MANAAVGFKGYVQIGRENPYGTAVTTTHRFGILGGSFESNSNPVQDAQMYGTPNAKAGVATVSTVTGTLEMYADYSLAALLLDGLMGTATYGSNGGSTTGSNPYTHTWNDAKTLFNSFTIELFEGDVPTTKCALITGAKITGGTFSWSSGSGEANYGKLSLSFVAKRKQTNQSPSATLSARTIDPILFRHLTTITDGSGDAAGDVKLESLEVRIANSLLAQATGGSGAYIDEPVLDGMRVPVVSWTARRHTVTLEDAHEAQTAVNPVFGFANGASKGLTFTFAAGRVSAPVSHSLSEPGVIRQSVTVTGYDGGSYALQVALVNAKSTITTI